MDILSHAKLIKDLADETVSLLDKHIQEHDNILEIIENATREFDTLKAGFLGDAP